MTEKDKTAMATEGQQPPRPKRPPGGRRTGDNHDAALLHVSESIQEVLGVISGLFEELKEERFYRKQTTESVERNERTFRLLMISNIIASVLFTTALIVVTIFAFQAKSAARDSKDTSDVVRDCTVAPSTTVVDRPTCYERGQANQAGALSVLDQANQQRQQELLDAINRKQPTIQRQPITTTTVVRPSTSTTMTTSRSARTTTTTTRTATTTTTTSPSPSSTTSTTAKPPSTTSCTTLDSVATINCR